MSPDISRGFQEVDSYHTDSLVKFLEDALAYPIVRECFDAQLDAMRIQPGQHILDIGCGIGDHAMDIAKLVGPTGRVVGTDISQAMVEASVSRHSDSGLPLEFYVAPADEQPFPDHSFDCIHLERVLIYVNDLDAAFREFRRLLKPRGRLLIYDMLWDALTFSHPDKELTRRIVHFIADSFPSGRAGTELWQYFRDHGFRGLDSRMFGYGGPDVEFPRRVVEGITRSGVPNTFTQQEIDDFWHLLEEQSRRGRFFSVFPGVMVTGVKGQ
jgi:ubiquinone/menaquinone biosynthesis C-methylase UbiE